MFGARNAFMTKSGKLAIGGAFGGGFYAGQISTTGNSIADFNLVVGPLASAQTSGIQYKTSDTSDSGTSSVINGPLNSSNMNDAAHPAAQFCEGLTIGGFSDWYMPAINELEICYFNLKPNTTSNNTGYGINANAVPARASNYTAGNPARTSAAIFQGGGAQQFTNNYWYSTQHSATTGGYISFIGDAGYQGFNSKTGTAIVRAVRRVAV